MVETRIGPATAPTAKVPFTAFRSAVRRTPSLWATSWLQPMSSAPHPIPTTNTEARNAGHEGASATLVHPAPRQVSAPSMKVRLDTRWSTRIEARTPTKAPEKWVVRTPPATARLTSNRRARCSSSGPYAEPKMPIRKKMAAIATSAARVSWTRSLVATNAPQGYVTSRIPVRWPCDDSAEQPVLLAGHRPGRGALPAPRLRELGAHHQPHPHHRLLEARGARPPRMGVRNRSRDRHPPRALPLGPGPRPDVAGSGTDMSLTPEAILALIATAGVGIAFLLMLEEAIALRRGRDPMSNGAPAFVERFPPGPYF